jgi:uncharacterized protein YjbJ (UPF0337 family)
LRKAMRQGNFLLAPPLPARPQRPPQEFAVTWEELRGNWRTLGVQVQRQWDKLSNQDMNFIQGRRPELETRLMDRYGFTREQAASEVERWHSRQTEAL